MNILGIVLLIITAVCIWRGYARGLFQMLLIVAATVCAMALSSYLSPYVSKGLQQYTKIDEKIETAITKQLEEYTLEENEDEMIYTLPVPEAIQMAIKSNNYDEVYESLNVNSFQAYLARYLSCVCVNAIAFVIVQIIITVTFFVLLYVTKVLTEIPIIHGIDKTGGVILGLIQALAIIWSLFIVIALFGNTSFGMEVYAQIEDNQILKFLYENNLLLKTITDISNILFA